MSGPADDFDENTDALSDVRPADLGDSLHEYIGVLAETDERVRILTLAPDLTNIDAAVDAFTQVSDRWYTASANTNILTIRDRGTDPRPWIAVPNNGTETLATLQPDLSPGAIETIINETAEALRTLGLYNTVHGYLSPDDIYLSNAGDEAADVTVEVGGFGLEAAIQAAVGEFAPTAYTAPELLDNPDQPTEQTDVYRLAAVTYFALSGHPPVAGADLTEAIRDGPSSPPSKYDDATPAEVDDAVMQALSTHPEDRYDSPYAFGRAFLSAFDPTALEPDTDELESESGQSAAADDTDEDSTRGIDSLRRDASTDPAQVDLDAAGRFLDSNQPKTRKKATYVFKQVAKSDARRVTDYLDSVEPRFDDKIENTRHLATYVFAAVSREDPWQVTDYLDSVEPRLDDKSENTRHLATYVFAAVSREDPWQVTDYLDSVEPRLNDENEGARNSATFLFKEVSKEAPQQVTDYLDSVEPRLDDKNEYTRKFATCAFKEVSREEPGQVTDYLDSVEPRFDDKSENTRDYATYLFGAVSKEDPRQVTDYLDSVESRLDDKSENTRNHATYVFKEVSKEAPQQVTDYLDSVEPRLDDENEYTRNHATSVFMEVSEEDPRQVTDYLDSVEPRLNDENEDTRECATSVFKEVSREEPGQVTDYLDSLGPRLDDENETIKDRAGSCLAQVASHDPEQLRNLIRSPESKQLDEATVERVESILAANTSKDGEDSVSGLSHVDDR